VELVLAFWHWDRQMSDGVQSSQTAGTWHL